MFSVVSLLFVFIFKFLLFYELTITDNDWNVKRKNRKFIKIIKRCKQDNLKQ